MSILNRNPRDFTNRYNTPLSSQEEIGYKAWLNTVHPNQRNTYDYDLQGYYKAAIDKVDPKRFTLAVDPKGNLHFDDRFKKPNHYTFSTDSQYNGRDGYYGGQWTDLGNGKWSFAVHPSNLYSNKELRDYFNRNEKGNLLIDSRGNAMAKLGFLYPEQLTALRAKYPGTQFNAHGEVTGGIPIEQYTNTPGILIRPKTTIVNPAAIPASVQTYSVFDPTSNSWKRMTNNGRSPIPAQGQTLIPTQTPTTTPRRVVRASRNTRISNPAPATVESSNAVNAVLNNMRDVVAASGVNLTPNYNDLMPRTNYENFQQEISRSNIYGPLNNPRRVRNMSPDYQIPTSNVTKPVIPAVPFPEYIDRPITRDLLLLGRGFKRLFSRQDKAEEAANAIRLATGLPPLE